MKSILSTDYLSLCRRIEQLRKHLLPIAFVATGNYSDQQFDLFRGFVALAHAEIEAFIENRCLQVAEHCVNEWLKNRKPSPTLISLHAICYSDWNGLIENPQFKKLTIETSVEARIADSLKQYGQAVSGNNGIKEADLKRLLVPLSIRMSDLDPDWLSYMNSFGSMRGSITHQTSIGLKQQPDPKDLRKTVWRELIPGLRSLDKTLTMLMH